MEQDDVKKARMNIRRLIVPAVIASLTSVGRADFVIDSFQDNAGFPITSIPGGLTLGSTVDPYPHVIGGRGYELTAISAAAQNFDSITLNIDNTDGLSFLDYSSTSGGGGHFTLNYGSDLPSTAMALSINPTTDFLRIEFLEYDHANGSDMQVETTLGTGLAPNDKIVTMSNPLGAPGAQEVDVPLAAMGGDTLDFIALEFDAPAGTDFRIDSITVITSAPEPQSLCLLGLAVSFLAVRRSRPQ